MKKAMKGMKTMKGMKKSEGKGNKGSGARHFKFHEIHGKPVEDAHKDHQSNLEPGQGPSVAAKRLYSAYLKSLKNGNSKSKAKHSLVFSIRESTRGAGDKIYGPYEAKYHKFPKPEVVTRKDGSSTEFKGETKVMKVKKDMKKTVHKGG